MTEPEEDNMPTQLEELKKTLARLEARVGRITHSGRDCDRRSTDSSARRRALRTGQTRWIIPAEVGGRLSFGSAFLYPVYSPTDDDWQNTEN
jgi:hypothetical protein